MSANYATFATAEGIFSVPHAPPPPPHTHTHPHTARPTAHPPKVWRLGRRVGAGSLHRLPNQSAGLHHELTLCVLPPADGEGGVEFML